MRHHRPLLALALASSLLVGTAIPNSKQAQGPKTVSVGGVPRPERMIRIESGDSLVVPQGYLLVVTGVATTDQFAVVVDVLFDSEAVLKVRFFDPDNRNSFSHVPPGLVASSELVLSMLLSD